MAKKTYKEIKHVQFYKDKSCKIINGGAVHDLRVFPKFKAQVINAYGGVFGMAHKSNKNVVSKVVTCHVNGRSEYYYQLVVEGVVAYFKLLNTNLYDFDSLKECIEYDEVKFEEYEG